MKMYFITQFSVSWLAREARGQGFGASALSFFAAYARGASREMELCNGDLSFHFYDFPRILWRAWKDRHVYEGFQMVPLATLSPPSAFLFSTWAMKD